jgi:hypothetical protein
MADPNKILKLLRDELVLQTRHCKLLEDQQKALLACDRPRFCTVQAEQSLMMQLIEAQTTAREAAMHDDDGNLVALSELIQGLPPQHQRALGLVRDSLRKTLERVRELNIQNRKLIKNELEYIAFTLDLFVEAGRKAEASYGGRFRGRLLLDRCA